MAKKRGKIWRESNRYGGNSRRNLHPKTVRPSPRTNCRILVIGSRTDEVLPAAILLRIVVEYTYTADYWKSQGRKFCDFCKCWIADNKPSIEFHEGGKKHKENVQKRLKEIHKNSAKQARQHRKFEDDIKKMETAAMAAYLKDVENNTTDLTAERIIREKLTNVDNKKIDTVARNDPKTTQLAQPEANPRYNNRKFHPIVSDTQNRGVKGNRNQQGYEIEKDPCDPSSSSRPKPSSIGETKSLNGGKGKIKGKKNGRRVTEEKSKISLQQKVWYEALSEEGYTYYWHVETNESVWEPPLEGFASIKEQEEEAKEQALQEELLAQIAEDEERKKEETADERRANAEREKHREIRLQREEKKTADCSDDEQTNVIQFRRDYSVPERPEPYGTWKTVQVIERKPVDLQLPKREIIPIVVPTLGKDAPLRVFKEKTVSRISTGDSDEETNNGPAMFKKRKFGAVKNVRKRFEED